MYKSLNTGAIGIKGFTLAQTIDLAKQTGFEGVDFDIKEVAQLGVEKARALFQSAGIKPGAWGVPVDWRGDEAKWREGVDALPALAQVAQQIGADRMITWVMPNSDTRPFRENYDFHVSRFRPIAEAVKPYGVRFGLEFIGPQSLRPADKYPFIYTLGGMMEMAATIGTGNVGLLLDVWHLYTSGGSVDDLDSITQRDIVAVHVNDAPEGLTMAEYQDLDRRLPLETGVLPLADFMRKLHAMDYDGPVIVEPFSQRVNAIADPLEAAKLVADHISRLWQVSGLA